VGVRQLEQRVETLESDLEDLNRSITGMREELQFVQRLLEDPGKKKRPT
jgi:chaperonin cofactor prefoldin